MNVAEETIASIDPLVELEVLRRVAAEFEKLDVGARERTLAWLGERYLGRRPTVGAVSVANDTMLGEDGTTTRAEYATFAEFFAAAGPRTEADKVLVAAGWFQGQMGFEAVDAFSLNRELRNLGHELGNITRAFGSLMERKPVLAVQTRKSGSSRQGRKQYRLTVPGLERVNQMVRAKSHE